MAPTRNPKVNFPRRAAFAAAAVLLAAALASLPERPFNPVMEADETSYVDPGEALLHGVGLSAGSVSFNMPLSSLAAATLYNHAYELLPATRLLCAAAAAGLVVSVGTLLGSVWVGLGALAALLAARPGVWFAASGYPHTLYTLLVLLVVGAYALYLRRPSVLRAALLGTAVAASVLFRSPLLLLPPVVLLVEAFRGKSRRGAGSSAAVLLLAAYLPLTVWVGFNRVQHGKWIFIEHLRADTNLIAGAHGLVSDGEADVKNYAQDADEARLLQEGKGLQAAGRRVLLQPGAFAASVLRRLGHFFLLNPFLVLAACAGAWLTRSRPEGRAAAVVGAYYAMVHCAIGFETWYFEPAWPVLALCAAQGLTAWRAAAFEDPERLGAPAERVLIAGIALAGAFSAWGLIVILGYPAQALKTPLGASQALTLAVERWPRDPWLLSQMGRRHVREGRAREGVEALERAAAGRPDDFRLRIEADWALALTGEEAGLLEFRFPGDADDVVYERRLHLLRAAAHAMRGRSDGFHDEWRSLESLLTEELAPLSGAAGRVEREVAAKAAVDRPWLRRNMSEVVAEVFDEGARTRLIEAFSQVEPECRQGWLERSVSACS